MLLAGDIGGTKTLLGLYDPSPVRPRAVSIRSFPTLEFDDLTTMIAEFIRTDEVRHAPIDAACFGVAGPVIADAATLTNVPWRVDARGVERAFGIPRGGLLNDLQAIAPSGA